MPVNFGHLLTAGTLKRKFKNWPDIPIITHSVIPVHSHKGKF